MIAGFVGANGSGKTLGATSRVLAFAKRFPERDVLSTVPLDTPRYVELKSWQQIVQAEPPFILMLDEVAALADARSTMTLPPHVLLYIGSLRHRDVVVFWTAPAWSWADVRLRGVTTDVFECVPALRHMFNRRQAWAQTALIVQHHRRLDMYQGDALPPRSGFPSVRIPRLMRSYGRYPTRRDPMAISEFARICPQCGKPKRKRDAYCRCANVDDAGLVPIHLTLERTSHAGLEEVAQDPETLDDDLGLEGHVHDD